MKKAICIFLFFISVFGCDDPKKANHDNFTKAIQPYLESKFPSCFYHGTFPEKKETLSFSFSNKFKKLDVLVNAGLVEFKKKEVKKVRLITGGYKKVAVGEYYLTVKGKSVYQENAGETLSGKKIGGFCIGKPQITEITNFTEPNNIFGHTISNVKFKYRVDNIPDWAKSNILLSSFSLIRKYADSEKNNINDTAVLILTDKGWVHEKIFDKK